MVLASKNSSGAIGCSVKYLKEVSMLKFICLGILFCMSASTTWAAELSLQSGESAAIRMNVDTRVTCNAGNSGPPSSVCGKSYTDSSCAANFINGACAKSDGSRGLCAQTNFYENKPVCACL